MRQSWMWAAVAAGLGLAVACGSPSAKVSQRPIFSTHAPRSGPKAERSTVMNRALSHQPNRARLKKVASAYHPVPAAQYRAGEQLYRQQCQRCHGPTGAGSNDAPRLAAPSAVVATFHNPTHLARFIQEHMPPDHPGMLTPKQAHELAQYIWRLTQSRD